MPLQVRQQLSTKRDISSEEMLTPRLKQVLLRAVPAHEEPCLGVGKIWLMGGWVSRYSSTYQPGQAEPGELDTNSHQQGKHLYPDQVPEGPVCLAEQRTGSCWVNPSTKKSLYALSDCVYGAWVYPGSTPQAGEPAPSCARGLGC